MKNGRVIITAASSGSGKTLITCGLMEALKRRNLKVAAFKCGPDYIDPMFHKTVLGLPSKNLDSFLADEDTLKCLFVKSTNEADISVIEGVMGYYDGMAMDSVKGSTYHIGQIIKAPAILIINAKGMGMSTVAAIKGFMELEENSGIKGVILNRITKMTYLNLAPVIEKKLGIKVVGFVPDTPDCQLESRHLGLVTPAELDDIKLRLSKMADVIEENVNIDLLMEIANKAEPLHEIKYNNSSKRCIENCSGTMVSKADCKTETKPIQIKNNCEPALQEEKPIIAVAYDEAFCFYYEDNLHLLRELGADIKYFSPLTDSRLPDNCQGILLGGGYPEIYARKLSENIAMLEAVRNAYESQMPIIAECGGFMYLHDEIEDLEHNVYKMAGVIKAKAVYTGKLSRFGYINIILNEDQMYGHKGDVIRGHEFHYYDSSCNGVSAKAVKPSGKRNWQCINGNQYFEAGFPHLYYYSNVNFAKNFVDACKAFEDIKRG